MTALTWATSHTDAGQVVRLWCAYLEALPEGGNPAVAVPEPLIEDPVVARTMEAFMSVTLGGKTMYDSRDGLQVTGGLMLLHNGGHRFDLERLFSAALRADWKGRKALRFREVALEVARGVRKTPKERRSASHS